MDISKLTIEQAREIAAMFNLVDSDTIGRWQVGRNYLIRTVTMTVTGKLVHVSKHELTLVDAAWIAETGRYADALVSCSFSEVEPYPDGKDVFVGRGAIVDAVQIDTLPRVQK